jgi:hypothetical protein
MWPLGELPAVRYSALCFSALCPKISCPPLQCLSTLGISNTTALVVRLFLLFYPPLKCPNTLETTNTRGSISLQKFSYRTLTLSPSSFSPSYTDCYPPTYTRNLQRSPKLGNRPHSRTSAIHIPLSRLGTPCGSRVRRPVPQRHPESLPQNERIVLCRSKHFV